MALSAAVAAVRRFAAAAWCQVLYSSKSGLPNHWPVWPENIVIVQYMSTCSIHIVIFRASQLVRSTFFFWDVICRSPFAGLPICPIPLYSRQGRREVGKIWWGGFQQDCPVPGGPGKVLGRDRTGRDLETLTVPGPKSPGKTKSSEIFFEGPRTSRSFFWSNKMQFY